MAILNLEFDYSWHPFRVKERHLTFAEHETARLERAGCSHWGPVVYKWDGEVVRGPNAGKRGILIGETGDLRQRVKAYISGTQDRGNRLWRETFLCLSEAKLYVVGITRIGIQGHAGNGSDLNWIANANRRLILEQLLVMEALTNVDESVWVVDARQ